MWVDVQKQYGRPVDPSKLDLRSPASGRIGFLLLGMSFLFWSFIMAGSLFYGHMSEFLNSSLGTALGLMSIALTVAGIPAVFLNFTKLAKSGKAMLLGSSTGFAALQLFGIYLIFGTLYQGLAIPATDAYAIYLAVISAVFVLNIIIYAFFLLPFLGRPGKILLLLASIISFTYSVVVLLASVHLYLNPPVPAFPILPGDNMPLTVSVFSPFFGLPGFILSSGFPILHPAWAMIFPLASNAIYAALCFSIRNVSGAGVQNTANPVPPH